MTGQSRRRPTIRHLLSVIVDGESRYGYSVSVLRYSGCIVLDLNLEVVDI